MMCRRSRAWLSHAVALAAVCVMPGVPSAALAEENAELGLYESSRVLRVLQARSFSVDPQPQGKRVAFIELVREEVLVGEELLLPVMLPRFAPTWPNILHPKTREDVIRRELLVAVGDRYDQERVDESERNLRALGIFSLVRIVPIRNEQSDRVGLLVYTRDLWSLRLETLFAGTGNAFQLTAQLTERNLLGTGKHATLRFDLDPMSFSLGQVYEDRRLANQELLLSEYFDLIFNRDSGQTEGSQAYLLLSHPFYSLEQQWSWSLAASYDVYVARSLRGSEVVSFRPNASGGLEICEPRAPDCLRSVWDAEAYSAKLSVSYRRGTRYKQTFTLGAGFSTSDARANAETELLPGQEQAFQRYLLPSVRRQAYPFVTYDLRLPDFVVFYNLSSFGRSENVRIGPLATVTIAAPLSAFGSSSDSLTFTFDVGHVLAMADALAEARLFGGARLEEGQVLDQSLAAVLRGASPPWLLGRLVAYLSWFGQRHDSTRSQAVLGGDNGLRGYPSGAFRVIGGNRIRANVEYRTLPLVFASVHLGGTLFYDAGSVYQSLARAELHHAVGVGVRILFPQVNLTPFRGEFGIPLDGSGFSVLVTYGTEAAIPLTASDDLAAASAVRSH